MGWRILGVAVTLGLAAVAAGPSQARAAPNRSPIVSYRTEIRFRDFAPRDPTILEHVDLRLRASSWEARTLRAHRIDSQAFAEELAEILSRSGLYSVDDSVEDPGGGAVRASMSVGRGTAAVSFAQAPWWRAESVRGQMCFQRELFAERTRLPALVTLDVSGYKVESVRPMPLSDDGRGRVRWRLPKALPGELVVCGAANPNTAAMIRGRSGWWRLFFPPVDLAAFLLVFGLALFIVRRAREAGDGELVTGAAVVTKGAFLVFGLILLAYWTLFPSQYLYERRLAYAAATRLYELGLTVALVAVAAGALLLRSMARTAADHTLRNKRWVALVATIGAALIGVLAAEKTHRPSDLDQPFMDERWYSILLAAGVGLVVLASIVIAIGSVATLSLELASRAELRDRMRSHPAFALAERLAWPLAGMLGAYWILGSYLTSRRDSFYHGFDDYLLNDAVYAGLAVLTVAFVSLIIPLFFGAVSALSAARPKEPTVAVDKHHRWVGVLIAFVFACFVVGRGGSLARLRIPLPVAFVIGFLAVLLLMRRREPKQPTTVDIGTGPESDWWRNGLAAGRLAVPLAVVPFAFYAVVLLNDQLGESFAFDNVSSLPSLAGQVAAEAIFWLAAALVLGWLIAYLPGSNCALKGLTVAVIYAVSVGLGKLATGGIRDEWSLRAFLLVLFYIGLGVRLDLAALERAQRSRSDLVVAYRLGTGQGLAGYAGYVRYAGPALLALIGIAQQLHSGDLGHAGTSILSNLSALLSNVSDRPSGR